MKTAATLVTLTLLLLSTGIGFILPFLMKTKFAIPRPLSIHEVSVQLGDRPSGKFGFKILQEITQKPHPFNSKENLKVRGILKSYLQEISNNYDNQWGCTTSNPLKLLDDDPVNLKTGNFLFESSNLILLVRGASNSSLLVSSHFDSASVSHGATDAGLAIGSMVSVAHAIARKACFGKLTHSLVFNFNNGEEINLLGGEAFTYHPLFKDVKAFINLEGTGVSGVLGSSIFRTNSFTMISLAMKSSTHPSSSILANNAMRFLISGTDYQHYAKYIPGLDIAFYSYRYLYHTPRDDDSHTSPQSLQHMADNLLSNINSIVNSSFLEHVRLEPKYQNATVQSPPVPSFLFFDRFGLFGVAETQFTFLTSIIALFGVIGVTFILRIACSSKFKIYQHFIRPSLNSFLSVIFAFVITMCISFIFAIVKQFVNPDTVYGHPELSAISTVFFVLASLCLSEIVWQHVSIALKLSDRPIFFDSIYETLSASEPLDFSTDSDDEHVVRNSDNANSEDIHDEGFSDERYSQANTQSNLGDYAPDFNLHPELMPLIVNTQGSALSPVPRIREKSQVLCAWFPVGILMFWTCSLIAALIFSMEGFSILYLTYDLALFSTANLLLTFFLEYYYLKLLHQDLFVAQTIFQERFVLFYEKYFWICQVLFCTAVPFLFVADVLHTAIVSLPSLIGEGLPSTVIDLSFTFLILIALIGTMPVLSQTDRSKTLAIFGTIAICLWIVQALLFSYSPDRPFKYRFHEIWDLDTNLTTSKVYLMPGMNGDQWIKQMKLPDTLLLGSDMLHWAGSVGEINSTFKNPKIPVFMSPRISKQSRQYIKGHLKGITESRACKLEILGSVTNFTILPSLLWLGASPQANPVTVLKRAYDTSDNEILIDFEIELMELISTPPAIRASCFLPLGNHSIVYNQFLSAKPDWTLCDGEGELGGLEVRRVFHLS